MQEDCEDRGDGVLIRPGLARANRRVAGETWNGALGAGQGRRLMPPDIGLLAALGLDRVPVRFAAGVVLFST